MSYPLIAATLSIGSTYISVAILKSWRFFCWRTSTKPYYACQVFPFPGLILEIGDYAQRIEKKP